MRWPQLALVLTLALVSSAILGSWQVRAATPTPPAGLAVHAPILIDGDSGFTAANGVTGGSGTSAAPYVIAGWDIDATSAVGIDIRNTNAYFVIRDVSIHGTGMGPNGISIAYAAHARVERANLSFVGEGIDLLWVSDVALVGNTITSTSNQGIRGDFLTDALLRNNTMTSTVGTGSYIGSSTNVSAMGNHVSQGGNGALWFLDVEGVVIAENVLSGNNWDAVDVSAGSNLTMRDNTISGNGGPYLIGSGAYILGTGNVSVLGNTITGNGGGLTLNGVTGGVVEANNISSNANVGLFLYQANATRVHGNVLDRNGGDGIFAVQSDALNATGNQARFNTAAGIGLEPASGSVLSGNNVSFNPQEGVRVISSTDVTLTGNEFFGNGWWAVGVNASSAVRIADNRFGGDGRAGARVYGSPGISLVNNTFQEGRDGVHLFRTTADTLTGNRFTGGGVNLTGIVLAHFNTHSITPDNLVNAGPLRYMANQSGLYVDGLSAGQLVLANVQNSTFTNLNVSGTNIGMIVAYVNFTTFRANTFLDDATGVSLVASSGLLFSWNNFAGNGLAVLGESDATNAWDAGYPRGNFWSSYPGVDQCGEPGQSVCPSPDGIGDTPYAYSPTVVDHYPLMHFFSVATFPPVPRLSVSPALGTPSTSFAFNASESSDPASASGALEFRWDWQDDGSWDTLWSSNPLATHAFAEAGTHATRVEIRNPVGLTASALGYVTVDSTAPVTTIRVTGTAGSAGWYRSSVQVSLVALDNESGVSRIQYSLDGGDWATWAAPFPVTGDGRHELQVRATNTVGLVEPVRTLEIDIDATPPAITGLAPSGTLTRSAFSLSWTATDPMSGVLRTEIRVDGAVAQSLSAGSSANLSLPDGSHVIEVRVTDAAGNVASSTVEVRVDTNPFSPAGPYQGLPTYLIVVAAGSGALLFLLLRRKRRGAPPPESPPGNP